MNRLRDFFHPSIRGGLTWARYCLLSLLISFSLVAHTMFPGLLGTFWVNGQSAPTVAALHINDVQYIVHSQSWWDASSCQCTPVDDVDYIFPYGVQEAARLPGGSWATYQWVTAGYIPGSGFYVTYRAPNGGMIAWYHLQWSSYGAMHGGDQIGVTEWPTDPIYGNGTSGPYDAHLCIAYDAAGAWWLMDALNHPPPAVHKPKPKPRPTFPLKRWRATVASSNAHHPKHHHARVSPYYRGKFSRIAADWWRGGLSKRVAGPGAVAHWDARNRVMVEHFPGKVTVYEWSRVRGAPLKWTRAHRTIRVNR